MDNTSTALRQIQLVFEKFVPREESTPVNTGRRRAMMSWTGETEFGWAQIDRPGSGVRSGRVDLRKGISKTTPFTSEHLANFLVTAQTLRDNDDATCLDPTHENLIWTTEEVAVSGGLPNITAYTVSRRAFFTYINAVNFDSNLTFRETSALFQFLGGATWRQAAQVDAVSEETKKTQFKAACAKLKARGQVAVTRKLISQLNAIQLLRDNAVDGPSRLHAFLETYLAKDARLHVIYRLKDRPLRFLESGPRNSKPILVFHGIAFPLILLEKARVLDRLNLRLITPIRPGFFEDASVFARSAGLSAVADARDIVDVLKLSQVQVLGSGFGFSQATLFAAEFPSRCTRLLGLSPYFASNGPDEHPFVKVVSALEELDDKPLALAQLADQFQELSADPESFLKILDGLLAVSELDRRYLRRSIGGRYVYEVLSEALSASLPGIVMDFLPKAQAWQSTFAKLTLPILLVRGTQDDITSAEICQSLKDANANAALLEIDGGGQFVETTPQTIEQTWTAMFSPDLPGT